MGSAGSKNSKSHTWNIPALTPDDIRPYFAPGVRYRLCNDWGGTYTVEVPRNSVEGAIDPPHLVGWDRIVEIYDRNVLPLWKCAAVLLWIRMRRIKTILDMRWNSAFDYMVIKYTNSSTVVLDGLLDGFKYSAGRPIIMNITPCDQESNDN